MDESDDPYQVLGVNTDATKQQIKVAYRKLALKHHPDKQKTEDDKKKSTVMFAKISNAYEILGDEEKRHRFDQQGACNANARTGSSNGNGASFHDNFASSNFHDHFFRQHNFHNPFEIFEQVFREEFGGPGFGQQQHHQQQHQQQHSRHQAAASPFNDPFFGNAGFGGMGGMPSMFNDPFFGGGNGGNGDGRRSQSERNIARAHAHDPFGGSMFSSMSNMMNMHNDMMRGGFDQDPNSRSHSVSYSTSSSSFGGRNGAKSTSSSTSTRIVNGKRQTVTEHIVTHPDGRVERKTETSGDDFPRHGNRFLGHHDGDQRKALAKRKSSRKHRSQNRQDP